MQVADEHQGMNRKGVLSIDEFLYCLGMIAAMRHLHEAYPVQSFPEAMERLLTNDLLPHTDPNVLLDPNIFRKECTQQQRSSQHAVPHSARPLT